MLSYLGRTIRVWQDGKWVERPGWGDVMRLTFPPPVGRRRVHNCEVPELELFPAALSGADGPLFRRARAERAELPAVGLLAAGRWFEDRLHPAARFFLNASLMLFPLGTTNGALAIWLKGQDHEGRPIERRIALVTDFDGPATPSSAAIVLARRTASRRAAADWVRFPASGSSTRRAARAPPAARGSGVRAETKRGWRLRQEIAGTAGLTPPGPGGCSCLYRVRAEHDSMGHQRAK